MKRLLSLLLFCNITISFLLAQPVHQVKGTVIDKSNRQPLEFINDCSLHLVDRLCQKEGYGYVAKQQKRQ